MLPDEAATRLLGRLRIRGPEDLAPIEDIAWAAYRALVEDGQLAGAEARVMSTGGKSVIRVSSAIHGERRRFAIAHELGHVEMHQQTSRLSLCATADITETFLVTGVGEKRKEGEANRFAAALLMPSAFFGPRCSRQAPPGELVEGLARDFGTSLTSTALRYLDFCKESCAVVMSVEGRIAWFHGSKDFRDLGVFIPVGEPLDKDSYASSFFSDGRIPEGVHEIEADLWFTAGKYRRDALLRETSWAIPSARAVLTLLWVYEDIEPEDEDC